MVEQSLYYSFMSSTTFLYYAPGDIYLFEQSYHTLLHLRYLGVYDVQVLYSTPSNQPTAVLWRFPIFESCT